MAYSLSSTPYDLHLKADTVCTKGPCIRNLNKWFGCLTQPNCDWKLKITIIIINRHPKIKSKHWLWLSHGLNPRLLCLGPVLDPFVHHRLLPLQTFSLFILHHLVSYACKQQKTCSVTTPTRLQTDTRAFKLLHLRNSLKITKIIFIFLLKDETIETTLTSVHWIWSNRKEPDLFTQRKRNTASAKSLLYADLGISM